MRSTGGNDVNFAMDAPKVDSLDIANLREKGAIIYGTATAASTGLGFDGPVKAESVLPDGNYEYALWGGQACNPYDTERWRHASKRPHAERDRFVGVELDWKPGQKRPLGFYPGK